MMLKSLLSVMVLGVMPAYALANCDQITTTVPVQGVNKVKSEVDPEFTYHLSGVSQCGTFIDGSKWVSGSQISILGIEGNGGTLGADFDPVGTDNQGFFNAGYGNYNANEDITVSLPFQVDTNEHTVLVSAIKRENPLTCGTDGIKKEGCVEAYDYLTFLSEPPPENAIRPSYLKAAPKTIQTYEQAIDDSILPIVTQFSTAKAEDYYAVSERWRHSIEIGGKYSEGGRAFRPHAVVENYASARGIQFYTDFATILAPNTAESARRAAIASIFVYSRDIYYAWVNPFTRAWVSGMTTGIPAGAGQAASNVTPANIFGALGGSVLDKSILRSMGSNRVTSYQEHKQINQGHDGPIWGDNCSSFTENLRRHWSGVASSTCGDNFTSQCNAGDTEGKRTCRDPHGFIDGPERASYNASYIGVTRGPFRDWCTITRAIPAIKEIFNFDDLCTYVDRLHDHGYKTAPDLCAGPEADQQNLASPYYILDWSKPVKGPGGWQAQACRKKEDPEACMAKTTFGETWGPVHGDLEKCIAGLGRYTNIDGAQIPIRNGSNVWGRVYSFFRENAENGGNTSDNIGPEISIITPTVAQAFSEGDLINVLAEVSDADGSIASVSFFVGNTNLGDVTVSPYSLSFNAGEPGNYTIRVIATDNEGDTSTTTRTIIVEPPLELRAPDVPENNVLSGLSFDYYEVLNMSSVEQLVGVIAKQGIFPVPSIEPRNRNKDYGFIFNGYVDIPTDGVYTFFTTSNDGSDLFIGDTKVVANDGNHVETEESGSIALQAGLHEITIRYFQRGGKAAFSTAWEGPEFSKQAIPATALSHEASQ